VLLNVPYTLQTYFMQVKPRAKCTATDGVLLGHLLADVAAKAPPHERAVAITAFVLRTTALRECGFFYLDAMLAAAFATHYGFAKFETAFARPVSTADPATLTRLDATTMGNGLEAIRRKSVHLSEAVDELFLTYTALDVMAQRQMWLRPMFETIVQRRMGRSSGLMMRLVIGVFLSLADMLSDINNLVEMVSKGQSAGAFALLGLIVASLALQVLLVVVQNKHRGRDVVAWEIFLVLSLLKPGVDAMRVANGEGHVIGAPLDPFAELIYCKILEMVFESIPGAALQASFVLSGGWTTAAVLSVAISCLATAFTATMLAYDLDTNAAKRKINPEFYGCVSSPTCHRISFGPVSIDRSIFFAPNSCQNMQHVAFNM
jgi:hypothetical protein